MDSSRSSNALGSRSSLTLGQLACTVLFPVLAVVDAVVLAAARCFQKRPPWLLPVLRAQARHRAGGRLAFGELADLADESRCCKYRYLVRLCVLFYLVLWAEVVLGCGDLGVSVNEVEALYELYKKISRSIIDDGLIHKVELSDDLVEAILDKTFEDADTDKDNRISTGVESFCIATPIYFKEDDTALPEVWSHICA